MFIATSQAEKNEIEKCKQWATCIVNLQAALRTDNSAIIAQALHKNETAKRTAKRFEYAIEWEMLGKDKVALWQEIKQIYGQAAS